MFFQITGHGGHNVDIIVFERTDRRVHVFNLRRILLKRIKCFLFSFHLCPVCVAADAVNNDNCSGKEIASKQNTVKSCNFGIISCTLSGNDIKNKNNRTD